MSYTGGNPQQDLADNEEAFAVGVEASSTVMHRRVEVPPRISQAASGAVSTQDAATAKPMSNFPKNSPTLDWDSSDESSLSTWQGSCADMTKDMKNASAIPSLAFGWSRSDSESETAKKTPFPFINKHPVQSPHGGSPLQEMNESDSIYEGPRPFFWTPFGIGDTGSFDSDQPESNTPRVVTLPSTFRLERTNLMVRTNEKGPLSVEALLSALRASLETAGVDVLDFCLHDCALECSFHRGNCFISLSFRVYLPPDEASGQLLSSKRADSESDLATDGGEDVFLIEAQLREGDRLRFSALFREVLKAFKTQSGMSIGGTYRYHPRAYPAVGEGLVLEEVSLVPSRQSVRLLAEQNKMIDSESNPTTGVRKMLTEGRVGAEFVMEMSPPLPPDMTNTCEELDSDMADDVITLAGMLDGPLLDVKTDAATAVAGLTADVEFLEQLSRPEAVKASTALCRASVRVLVESRHRPARRQASVIVANLATTAELRSALLAWSAAVEGHGLVDSLVSLAMGDERNSRDGFGALGLDVKEEEIGTRRECMRALVGLAECRVVRDTLSVRSLAEREPSGRGASDATLIARLAACRDVLSRK